MNKEKLQKLIDNRQQATLGGGAAAIEKPADSIDRNQIERVIREIHKGRSVSQIASALKMDPGITEQICRLVLTHPGVDADGIMMKMGL